MKVCKTCREEKDDNAFSFRRKATGLRATACRICYNKRRSDKRPPLPLREYPTHQQCRVFHIEKAVAAFPGAKSTIRKMCRECKSTLERIRVAGLKWCRMCKTSKPPEDFHFLGTKQKQRRAQCKACVNLYESLPSMKAKLQQRSRQYQTGFTPELWRRTLALQHHRCAVCAVPFSELTREPHGDHCHSTQQPRGILCPKCNTAIGLLDDDPARLRRAATYLEHAPCDDLLKEVTV